MRGWLMTLCAGSIVFAGLQWLVSDGAVKKTAKLAFGIVFMQMVLSPLLRLLTEGFAWMR